MKICFIPIDNRPVCYNLAVDIAAIDKDIELFIPPREYLGSLTKYADVDKIYEWFKELPQVDKVILSLDTIAYGGLIPSRRANYSEKEIKERVLKFRSEWVKRKAKVLAFSSIMRISNNNYNEEEKEYWKDYGTRIVIHTCGPYDDRFDLVLKESGDAWHISDTQTKKVKDAYGDRVSLMGNIPCVSVLMEGTEQQVYDFAYQECIDGARDGRFILSGDCDLPPATPDENIKAAVRAAKDAEKVLFGNT